SSIQLVLTMERRAWARLSWSLASRDSASRRSRKSRGRADPDHFFPTWPGIGGSACQRAIDHQSGHLLDDMLEIKLRNTVALEVRCGIQEVDGIWHSILDRKLNRVHFVAQCLIDRLRILDDACSQL